MVVGSNHTLVLNYMWREICKKSRVLFKSFMKILHLSFTLNTPCLQNPLQENSFNKHLQTYKSGGMTVLRNKLMQC